MRKSIYLVLITICGMLFSCIGESSPESDLPPIRQVFDDYYNEIPEFLPKWATFLGLSEYNDKYVNQLTSQYRDDYLQFLNSYIIRLGTYDRNQLSKDERLNYDILVWSCQVNINAYHDAFKYVPINQFDSENLFMSSMASGTSIQPFHTTEDYDNWLKRIYSHLEWLDTAIVNLGKDQAKKIRHPRAISQKLVEQLELMVTENPVDHPYFQPVKNVPNSFGELDSLKYAKEFTTLIEVEIVPRYQKIRSHFQEDLSSNTAETSFVYNHPDGKEIYQNQLSYYTSLDISPDSVFDLGMSEVDRIEKEMLKVKNEVGFGGSLSEFFEFVRENPELIPFSEPEEVLHHFDEIHQTVDGHIDDYFNLTPETPFEVRRTNPLEEKTAAARYMPGAPEVNRPGVFEVPIPDIDAYNIHTDEALFLHEAIPGHHYQIMLQKENKEIHDFRKFISITAFTEGWALYAESLGQELGLYNDPYQYFGMLSSEMHRAIRLVVDAGLHYKGWTRDEAIAFSLQHESYPEDKITREIERYMVYPGQAVSYKIGQLTIQQLRKEAEIALGDNFDIKEFHDLILKNGALPLEVLKKNVREWVNAQVKV